jgi:hypothetical protein
MRPTSAPLSPTAAAPGLLDLAVAEDFVDDALDRRGGVDPNAAPGTSSPV